MDKFLLCDTEDTLNNALAALALSPRIALDCEGKDLGQIGGKLSLISLRTSSPLGSQTFLIDALLLDDSTLRPLFDVLESPETIKIVFDGRMDFSELYHSRSVSLTGILDLQLADISSRRLRGEGEEKQLRRLSPYLLPGAIASHRNCYTQVQKLGGLAECLKEHGVAASKDRSVSHSLWLKRPLSIYQLLYAACDVYAIEALFEHFQKRNYIDEELLLSQSQRYITLWKDERPKHQDAFKSHALLPLDILDRSYGDTNPNTSKEGIPETLVCTCCKRALPLRCFSHAAGQNTPWRCQCWICRALNVKNGQEAQSSRILWEDEAEALSRLRGLILGPHTV